jgi:hypothetical protein
LATRVSPRVGRRVQRAFAAGALAIAVAGCAATEAPGPSLAAPTARPSTPVTSAVSQTRGELFRVLAGRSLVLGDTQTAVKPAEAPLFAAAARAVYQVLLPKDPTRGLIVVYEFRDPSSAAAAAAEQAAYLATGPGRVQTPEGTVSIIRQVGSTVVFYSWLPSASKDPSAPGIQAALETLGVGYPVPA